jgi:hypothetical protein
MNACCIFYRSNSQLIGWVFLEAPETKMHVNLTFGYWSCASLTGTSLNSWALTTQGGSIVFLPVVRPSSTGVEMIRVLAAEMQEWAVRG